MNNLTKWLTSPVLLVIIAGTLLSLSSTLNPGYGMISGGVAEVAALLLLQFNIIKSVLEFATTEATEDYFTIRHRGEKINHTKSWLLRTFAVTLVGAICCLPVYFALGFVLMLVMLAAVLLFSGVLFWYVFNEKLNDWFVLPKYTVGTTAFIDKLLRRVTGGEASKVRFVYWLALCLATGFYLGVLGAFVKTLLTL